MSTRTWALKDEGDAHKPPYPPSAIAQQDDPRSGEELSADPAVPNHQQVSGKHRHRDELSQIGPPRNAPQPVDSVLEPRHTERESSSVRDTADYIRDAAPHDASRSAVDDDSIDSAPQPPIGADRISPGNTNGIPSTVELQQFSREMAVPSWMRPPSVTRSEYSEVTSLREPPAERPVETPPSGAPLPPPAPPPGWPPPGAFPPPAWWSPPGVPPWPPVPGATPPPPGWQQYWAGGAQSPPASMPPEVPPVQTFRMPPTLDEAKLVDRRTSEPQSGWRRAIHRATRGHLNPGDSRKERAHEDLVAQIRQPLAGDFHIAVLSVKGGVGKTTTTLGLGSALAMVRRDRVIAVDANPDRGTLAERVGDNSTSSTVRDLLNDPNIDRYADIRCHTRMAVSRLEVLASEQDPAAADVFDEADYRSTIDILGLYYNIILTDCGTGIMHSAMAGVFDLAHSIVLVSSPAIDAVRSASATLDWLMQHGYSDLVREGHVVLSAARPGTAPLKLAKVYEFFEARCRSIHFVPFDPHLAEGADVDFGMLKPATRETYFELAGAVAENFPRL